MSKTNIEPVVIVDVLFFNSLIVSSESSTLVGEGLMPVCLMRNAPWMALEVDFAVQGSATEMESRGAVSALVAEALPEALSAMSAEAFRNTAAGAELGMEAAIAAATWASATYPFL